MKNELVKYCPGHFDLGIPGEQSAVIVADGETLILDKDTKDERKVETKDLLVFTKAGAVLRTNVPHEDDKIEAKSHDEEGDKHHHAYWTE